MCINIDTSAISSYVELIVTKNYTDSVLLDIVSKTVNSSMDSLVRKAAIDTLIADKISNSHWYDYYSLAFQELVASHVGLFGALIAVAVAIFGFKYWSDNVNLKKIIDKSAKEKATEATKKEIPNAIKEVVDETYAQSTSGTIDVLLPLANEKEFNGAFFLALLNMLKVFIYRLQGRHSVVLLYSLGKLINKMMSYESRNVDNQLKEILKGTRDDLDIALQSYFCELANSDSESFKYLRDEWEKVKKDIEKLLI